MSPAIKDRLELECRQTLRRALDELVRLVGHRTFEPVKRLDHQIGLHLAHVVRLGEDFDAEILRGMANIADCIKAYPQYSACFPIALPCGVEWAGAEERNGLNMRMIRDYEWSTDKTIFRFDIEILPKEAAVTA